VGCVEQRAEDGLFGVGVVRGVAHGAITRRRLLIGRTASTWRGPAAGGLWRLDSEQAAVLGRVELRAPHFHRRGALLSQLRRPPPPGVPSSADDRVAPLDGWDELNSPRLRSLAIASLVEDMWRQQLDNDLQPLLGASVVTEGPLAGLVMSPIEPPNADDWAIHDRTYAAELAEHGAESTGRRGRRPVLRDDQLRDVVAPAYRGARSKPVQAVQRALQAYGMPGAGQNREVTIDQARKNVKRARRLGFIDPPAKKGKP
jgi:hypothetical protein